MDRSASKIDVQQDSITTRHAEILSSPQRIAPLAEDEFDEEARALVVSIRAALGAGTGPIPAVFGLMLRHPGLFRSQMEIGIELLGRSEIPPRERELAILRVGWWCRAPYEWGEHVDISKRYGVTADEVERVTLGSDVSGWGEHDRAILKGVEELLGDQMISDATWAVLARSWTERQLLEFPMLVGQYFATALQQNALRVRLAEDNPGLTHR
ncbi:MAG: carboxymuconolactone decarboxylase family protein [Sphingobium sp.]